MADMAALGARIRQLFDERTKTLIPDGPITITETAEGIVIGSTATGGTGTVSTIYPTTF